MRWCLPNARPAAAPSFRLLTIQLNLCMQIEHKKKDVGHDMTMLISFESSWPRQRWHDSLEDLMYKRMAIAVVIAVEGIQIIHQCGWESGRLPFYEPGR